MIQTGQFNYLIPYGYLQILVTFLVAAVSAVPINPLPAVPCAHAVAYAAAPIPAPAALTYAVPQVAYDFPAHVAAPVPAPVQVVAPAPLPQIQYDFPAPVSAPVPAPVAIAAPVQVAVASPVAYAVPEPIQVVVKPQIQYDFPAPISAPVPAPVSVVAPVQVAISAPAPVAYAVPAPIQVAAPAPVAYATPAHVAATAPVHYAAAHYAVPAPAFETRVHYAETPVVVGQHTQIMKPNLGAFMGYAAKDAPPMDQLVTKEKILAPARAVSEITPQVTVQHPTKVNIEKFDVEVPVAAPYAHPVPVPVAPQYEIHQYHHQRVVPVAPAVQLINGVPCATATA